MSEHNGHVNGNGNGNGIFSLSPKEDPMLAKVVPQARREVCSDTRITEGARMFYCFLTDSALLFGVYVRRGIVRYSNQEMSQRFNVSEKTIQNWKRALIETGRVWVTEKWMKHSWPMTQYHIAAICGEKELPLAIDSDNGSLVASDTFLSNRKRARIAVRDGNGRWTRGGVPSVAVETAKTSENWAFSTPREKILPSTAAKNFRRGTKPISAVGGNGLPPLAEKNCRRAAKPIAVDGGKKLPPWAEKNCRRERKPVSDKGEIEVRESDGMRKGEAIPPVSDSVVNKNPLTQVWKRPTGALAISLEKALKFLNVRLADAKTEKAKAEYRRRIAETEAELYGPPPEDNPAPRQPAAKPVRLAKEEKPLTDQELVETARYAVENKKFNLLQPAQILAWTKVYGKDPRV